MSPNAAEVILRWLMRVAGGMGCLAILAAAMPTSWMAAVSRSVGVDGFRDTALVQYLTRSVSLIYTMLGALTVYLSCDVRRYRDLIRFIGWLTIGFGIGLTAIDFSVGMPGSWSWAEGPPTILIGLALVWLVPRIPDDKVET